MTTTRSTDASHREDVEPITELEVLAWLIANRYCCTCPEDWGEEPCNLEHADHCGAPQACSGIHELLRHRLAECGEEPGGAAGSGADERDLPAALKAVGA